MAEAEESLAEVPQSEEINDTHEDKHRRMSYIPLPGVLRTFPDISPAKLCELADLKAVAPSKVLAIVPTASVTQLCDFCKLAVANLLAKLKSSNRGLCYYGFVLLLFAPFRFH